MSESVLRAVRKRKGLTGAELGRESGTGAETVSYVENFHRGASFKNCERWARELDVDPALLFAGVNLGVLTSKAQAGEVSPGQALQAVAKVAGTLKDLEEKGDLVVSPGLDKAIDKLEDVALEFAREHAHDNAGWLYEPRNELLDQIEGETEEDDEDLEGEDLDDGRDFYGRRVKKMSNSVYTDAGDDGRDFYGRRIRPLEEAAEDNGDYDDLDDGRDFYGRRVRPLGEVR